MKIFAVILCAALLAGCAGRHPKGTARFDNFDAVKVEQMVGNNVAGSVFSRTIVCLNARRETRLVTAYTNSLITAVTNPTITAITNVTISTSTNLLYTGMTNLAPVVALPAPSPAEAAAAGVVAVETNVPGLAAITNTAPALTTNVSVTVANNASGTAAANQRTANQQAIRTYNNQLTTASNNLTVSLVTNIVTSAETNQTVSFVTNISIVAATNVIITPTNGLAFDYFLYSELIPPSDFTLAPGESLILLVDGVRHGFAQTNSGTAFIARKGYTSGLYRVPGDVLVAIANAKEVKIRFKGVNNVLERTMSSGSRKNFRAFVARYFSPSGAAPAPKKVAALEPTTSTAHP